MKESPKSVQNSVSPAAAKRLIWVDMENIAPTAPPPTRDGPEEDAQRVARFLAGDSAAFEEIVEVHQRRVTGLVYRLLDRPDDVDDVVQEVFLAVFDNLHRFRGRSRFSTWLTTIAVNKCRSFRHRRLLRWRKWFQFAEQRRASTEAHRTADGDESHERVRRAVGRLAAKYREPIVLRYFEQTPIEQIAEVLGISRGAVEVRLSRARARLKEILSHESSGA